MEDLYHMKMKDWLLKKLRVGEDEAVVVLEDVVEVETAEDQGVTCVIIVIKMVIMPKIVQNLLRKERHDYKMADALFVTKKDIRKLIVQIDVVVAVEAVSIEEVEVHQ